MIRAYHFVGSTLRDGRPIPPDGEWLVHDGPLLLCLAGLHASEHPSDALVYAPGHTLCVVDCDGEIIRGDNKLVCTRRRIVRRLDATALLREHARWCASQVLHLWDAPQVVRDYLATGDEGLRAAAILTARVATRAAATVGARVAAMDAATAAATAAAMDDESHVASVAARFAARFAASVATRYTATAVEMDAARVAQRDHLLALVEGTLGGDK